MDNLLRRSLSEPVPVLSLDFDRRLARELRRSPRQLSRSAQAFLAGYGILSAAVSVVVMRGQRLAWQDIAFMTIGPVVVLAAGRLFRHKNNREQRQAD